MIFSLLFSFFAYLCLIIHEINIFIRHTVFCFIYSVLFPNHYLMTLILCLSMFNYSRINIFICHTDLYTTKCFNIIKPTQTPPPAPPPHPPPTPHPPPPFPPPPTTMNNLFQSLFTRIYSGLYFFFHQIASSQERSWAFLKIGAEFVADYSTVKSSQNYMLNLL